MRASEILRKLADVSIVLPAISAVYGSTVTEAYNESVAVSWQYYYKHCDRHLVLII